MKKNTLIKKLQKAGCEFLRHGSKHDVWHNPQTGRTETVPRHTEINERLAKKIIKELTKQ